MADPETPGSVLRELVTAAVGGDSEGDSIAVSVAERGDDLGPTARLPALVRDASSIVGVLPRADRDLARGMLGETGDQMGALDDETTVRLVFTGAAADQLSGPAGAVRRSVLADHGVEAYRHDGDTPIGVLLVGETAIVGLFDSDGIAALLWSDAPAVQRWAAETCRRYLSAAEVV